MSISDHLEQISIQERELTFADLDEHKLWALGQTLRNIAVERSLGVVIDIRRVGQQLFYTALPGTTPDHPEWVRRKSNVTLRFHRASYALSLEMKEKNSTLLEKYALPSADYASHGGSFPLRVAGAGVVAAVTVSGLPQREDHELVIEGLCTRLGRPYSELRLP